MMQLGFTGPDSTGKSTLIEGLARQLGRKSLSVGIVRTGDIARKCPFPVVDDQTYAASNWIVNTLEQAVLDMAGRHEVVLVDRTPLDVWIFLQMSSASSVTSKVAKDFDRSIEGALGRYAFVFCAHIDRDIPVSVENLPRANYAGRERFEEVMLRGVEQFAGSTQFRVLPHELSERFAQINACIGEP